MHDLIVPSPDEAYLAKAAELRRAMRQQQKSISDTPTPQIDGEGRPIIKRRPDGWDYIIEAYMRDRLNELYPGWSLAMAAPLHFLGAEWVVAQVSLEIIDERLVGLGIIPPVRRYYGVGASRVAYRQGQPHTPESIIDIDLAVAGAVGRAGKRAINRLCSIGDDVYGKRIEDEGAGTLEQVTELLIVSDDHDAARQALLRYMTEHYKPISKGLKLLGVSSIGEITDVEAAYRTLSGKGR